MVNGKLPASMLAPIPGVSPNPGGKPLLRKDVAKLWIAMATHAEGMGVSFFIYEGPIRRMYRPLAAQELARRSWCGQGHCENAAVPGTSRHGLGINGDLSPAQRAWVDNHGEPYGWSKKWSDAPWEAWHVTCIPGRATVHLAPGRPVLRAGMKGKSVERVQRLLRAHGFKSLPSQGHSGYGYYGQRTRSAARRFQRAHHLPPDGVIGPRTWAALTNRRG